MIEADVPVDRPGRAYLVERGLEQDGYAAPLVLVEYVNVSCTWSWSASAIS